MIIKKQESLAPYTSFKIGGPTPVMYIPEIQKELVNLIKELREKQEEFYILGNGTNLLVNDKGIKQTVINNRQACNYIKFIEEGIVEVGSSYDLRKFIRDCVDKNLDAYTDLIAIPATMGGAIYMNAGRGGKKQCVSDNLIEVKIFNGKDIKTIKKEECVFSYRRSIFHNKKNWTIISAQFNFEYMDKKEGLERINQRLHSVKDKSYFKYPSAGSIFKKYNSKILRILMGLKVGGACYSNKDINSILNFSNARFKEVKRLIYIAVFLHRILLKKCELEVEIWD